MTTTQLNPTAVKTENQTNSVAQQHQYHSQSTLRPSVDIHENNNCIILYAELPGVSQDDLEITIDNDKLLLEAKASIETPAEMKPVYAEFQSANFKRSFTLSDELDTDQVKAKLTHGILELTIPKKELSKPRKIEVKVA